MDDAKKHLEAIPEVSRITLECRSCLRRLPLEDFDRDSRAHTKVRSICRWCTRAANRYKKKPTEKLSFEDQKFIYETWMWKEYFYKQYKRLRIRFNVGPTSIRNVIKQWTKMDSPLNQDLAQDHRDLETKSLDKLENKLNALYLEFHDCLDLVQDIQMRRNRLNRMNRNHYMQLLGDEDLTNKKY